LTSAQRTAQFGAQIPEIALGHSFAAELAVVERTRPKPERRKRKGGRRATDQPSAMMFDDVETRRHLARLRTLLHQMVDVVQALTARRRRP
jgi:hypothetical protein